MAGLDPAIPMRMAADWHCIFRKAEVGTGGWVKPSQHAVGESIISAFGITLRDGGHHFDLHRIAQAAASAKR
jgi:hypothetical protein